MTEKPRATDCVTVKYGVFCGRLGLSLGLKRAGSQILNSVDEVVGSCQANLFLLCLVTVGFRYDWKED